jgi:hypothetical protein
MAVVELVRRHVGVLRDERGRLRWPVWLVQWLAPLGIGAWVFAEDLRMSAGAAAAVLTVAGLFAAFSFSISVQMMSRAAAMADLQPERSRATSREADITEMVAGAGGYTSLVSLVATALALGVTMVDDGWLARVLVAATALALAHLAATISVIVVRVFQVTAKHLRDARSGAARNRAA